MDFRWIGWRGVAEVASHEELEGLMGTFAFAPFPNIEAYPLSDIDAAMDLMEANIAQMMEAVG